MLRRYLPSFCVVQLELFIISLRILWFVCTRVDVTFDLSGPRHILGSCERGANLWKSRGSSVCAAASDDSRRLKRCPRGFFVLPGMSECRPWLTCDDYAKDVVLGRQIGVGAVKQVFTATWKGRVIATGVPITRGGAAVHRTDFEEGYRVLVELGPSPHVVQVVGHCHDPPAMMMEYHRHGSADKLDEALAGRDTLQSRFQFCLDYAEILAWLHDTSSGGGGARVMCDSSDLKKTLEQYLVTDDLRLVLNDVDALPLVSRADGRLITCGRRRLRGDFVAPEQLWPYPEREYDTDAMPRYDEKTDVWKMPDVCQYFVSGSADRDLVLFRLFQVHRACKSVNPEQRPTAAEVLRSYRKVWKELYPR